MSRSALFSLPLLLVYAALFVGCDNDNKGLDDAGTDAARDAETDVALEDAPDSATDTLDPAPPTVGDVFDCGRTGAGGLAAGNDDVRLVRHDVDLDVYPDALCNDGTGAVFYYRPHVGAEHADRWVIQLQGGGGCKTAQECANRWCRVDTNFGMNTMTSNGLPDTTDGKGILARRVENPHGDWNQVFVKFCSSDAWSGRARDVDVEAMHPVNGGDAVPYRIHFLGHQILEAVIGTLRADAGTTLTFDDVAMPNLRDAEEVAFVGASAGGNGVVNNLDWLADELAPTVVRGLVDSAFFPELGQLDHSASLACIEHGHCDYESFARANDERSPYDALLDASCVASHEAVGAEYVCSDTSHVLRHHLTTPFFVRMGLQDSLLSSGFVELGFGVGEPGPSDLLTFATTVRRELLAHETLPLSAEEGAAISVAPGAYGPSCAKHETLRSDPNTYDVTVRSDGEDHAFMDVYQAWRTGGTPTVIATSNPTADVCPGR